jgi:hypothetical protein
LLGTGDEKRRGGRLAEFARSHIHRRYRQRDCHEHARRIAAAVDLEK